jgi:hypothetical protein
MNGQKKLYVRYRQKSFLVFEAKEGWEPLCNFLGKPIPDVPYPRVNDNAEFQARKNNKFNH